MPNRTAEPDKPAEPQFGAGYKLIGKNYTTADLYAKVTGQAKYAEDFRADGMLFCKLLLSPLPHARVTHLDTSAALAMPGVKAILTAGRTSPSGRLHHRQRHGHKSQSESRASHDHPAALPGRTHPRRRCGG